MIWMMGGLVAGAWLPFSAVFLLILLPLVLAGKGRRVVSALVMLGGLVVAQQAINTQQQRQLTEAQAGQWVTLSGRITGLPILREQQFPQKLPVTRAYFVLTDLQLEPPNTALRIRHLAVNWSAADPSVLQPGNRLRMQVELRTLRGRVNEEGFDSERNAFSRKIHARGRLRELLEVQPAADRLQSYRQHLTDQMIQVLADYPNARALIPATVNGDWRHSRPEQWRLLQETGTAHLITISGFHVTLVSGLVWWLARWALSLLLCRSLGVLSAQRLAVIPALMAAMGYTALAGFPLPALRACLMTTLVMVMLACLYRTAAWRVLVASAVLLLLVDPLAALDTSFWLSYGAVTWLLLIHRAGVRHPVTHAASMTAIFGVWVAWGFGQWNLAALPANLVLIPVYSFCIVPLALTGAVVAGNGWGVGEALLKTVGWVFELSWQWMEWLVAAPELPLPQNLWQTLLVSLVLIRVLFRALPGPLWPAAFLLLPWCWPAVERLPEGVFEWQVFDVGQAQMMALRTRDRLLLYDTGGAFDGNSSAREVLIPWLKRRRQLPDRVMVSHGDLDHAGGVADLRQWLDRRGATPVWLAGEAERLPGALPCQRGDAWEWNGVHFRVLWPAADIPLRRSNNRSCVLRVEGEHRSLLLSGDIETPVEHWLVEQGLEPVDWLQAPHHGSRTSSTHGFLRALRPRLAVASAGYRNRYGHPAKTIQARYRAFDVPLHSTVESGQLTLRSDEQKTITQAREGYPFPWRHRGAVLE